MALDAYRILFISKCSVRNHCARSFKMNECVCNLKIQETLLNYVNETYLGLFEAKK